MNVLLSLDEDSYSGGGMGDDHPVAWYHNFDGGRSWYTGGGHTVSSYAEDDFRSHFLGGILYSAGIDGPITVDPADPFLDRNDWVVTASHSRDSEGGPIAAIDGSIDTRWTSGERQAPGIYF